MKKYIPLLIGILLVQAGLLAVMLTRKDATATFQANENLLASRFEQVDRIELSDNTGKKVELKKIDGAWLTPGYFNFPVASKKVEDFAKALDAFKKSWPVGKTTVAAKQFKVDDKGFEREIVLYAGDKKLHSLYLGSSPSFRKVHVRVDEDTLTYSIDYNTYDLPVEGKEWIDKKFLTKLDKTKIKEVSIGGLTLQANNGTFQLTSGVSESQETNTDKTTALVTKLLNASFDEVADFQDKVTLGEKLNDYTLTTTEDKKISFTVYRSPEALKAAEAKKAEEAKALAKKDPKGLGQDVPPAKTDEEVLVVVSDRPYAFKVKQSRIDELFKVEAASLVKAKGQAPESKEGQESTNVSEHTEPLSKLDPAQAEAH